MKFGEYGLVATDGYAAAFKLDAYNNDKVFDCVGLPHSSNLYAELNESVYLALRRLMVITSENQSPYVEITFWQDTQEIEITAESESHDFIGRETIPANVYRTGAVYVDPEKLLQLLGVWPMLLYIPDGIDSPIVLQPASAGLFTTVLCVVKTHNRSTVAANKAA